MPFYTSAGISIMCIDNAILVMMLMPMTSHNPKGHAALHFNCLDIGNVMVSLVMLLASCEADAGANGVT